MNRITQLINIFLTLIIAALIWGAGPYLAFKDYYPLANLQIRIICTLIIFLPWIIYFIYLIYKSRKNKDKKTVVESSDKTTQLQLSFRTAQHFIKKQFKKQWFQARKKPWILLLGLNGSGKSTLLASLKKYPAITFSTIYQKNITHTPAGLVDSRGCYIFRTGGQICNT